MNDTTTDHLMFYALDFTEPFTAAELRVRADVHAATVGVWLVAQVRKGNLRRRKVDGLFRYEWVND